MIEAGVERAEWGTQKCVVYFKFGCSTCRFGCNLDALRILSNHPFSLIKLGLFIRNWFAFGLACRPLQITHVVMSLSRDWLWLAGVRWRHFSEPPFLLLIGQLKTGKPETCCCAIADWLEGLPHLNTVSKHGRSFKMVCYFDNSVGIIRLLRMWNISDEFFCRSTQK